MRDRPTIVHMIASPVRSAPRVLAYHLAETMDRSRYTPAMVFLRRGYDEAEDFGMEDMLGDFQALDMPIFTGTMEKTWQVHDARRLDRFLRKHEAQVIVSHLQRSDVWTTAMSWWGRAKSVRLVHGMWNWWDLWTPPLGLHLAMWLVPRLDRALLRHTDWVVCVSPATLEVLATDGGVPRDRLRWIRTGIDIEHFRASRPPLVDEGPVTFGMVARVLENKGTFEFLESLAGLQRRFDGAARGVFAGEGPDLERAKAQASSLGVDVEFCGHVSDIRTVLSRLDVFVLPSWWEGAPLSLLEAMAAGRVPIVSDAGGMPWIVEHERNGLVVPRRDAAALEAAMARIVQDKATGRQLAAEALADSELYSISRMGAAWNDFYAEVLAS